MKSTHGAFPSFVSNFSDAFFITSDEDLNAFKKYLKENNLVKDASEMQSYLHQNWDIVKKHCRRFVPDKNILKETKTI